MTDNLPPPEGFVLLVAPNRFIGRSATFFMRETNDENQFLGCWITDDQANSDGVAHGGFLLTFADFALSFLLNGITLSLSAEFLRPARVGDWIESRISARKRGPTLIFADTLIVSGPREIMRVGGLFRPYEKKK